MPCRPAKQPMPGLALRTSLQARRRWHCAVAASSTSRRALLTSLRLIRRRRVTRGRKWLLLLLLLLLLLRISLSHRRAISCLLRLGIRILRRSTVRVHCLHLCGGVGIGGRRGACACACGWCRAGGLLSALVSLRLVVECHLGVVDNHRWVGRVTSVELQKRDIDRRSQSLGLRYERSGVGAWLGWCGTTSWRRRLGCVHGRRRRGVS